MSYIPPFEIVKQKVKIVAGNGSGTGRVEMQYTDFMEFMKLMIRAVQVDETWYRTRYPDVADAITDGTYKSAKHHFVEEGYFEGRFPYEFGVDDDWYVSQYSDIAAGIKAGALGSPKEHFLAHGYAEGRLPTEY